MALQEKQDRYRTIMDKIPLLICSYLPGGEILFVNKSYCNYFNKPIDELLGSNFLSLIPESDQGTVMNNILSLTVESPTQSHEHVVIAMNGVRRWQRWTNRAIFNDQGKAVEYYSIGEDITERKMAEYALQESEELHRVTLGNISDAVFITDESGDFTYICPNVDHIFGYSFAEVKSLKNIETLLGINIINLHELENSKEIKNIECVVQDKSNMTHYLLVNVKLVSIKNGKILFTCRDITDHKITQEKLSESKERYRQLFDNESDAVMIFDAESKRFEDVNPAALNLFGYSKDEYLNLTVEDISSEKNKTRESVNKIISGDSEAKYIPLRYFLKKNGEKFPGEICAGTFISNGRKKIIGAVRDINNRVKAEEAINELSFNLLTTQEYERKCIASELHDDFGQTLAFLKIQIRNIQDNLPKDQNELTEKLENTIEYTNQLIEKVRTLSHGLTPFILNDLGLSASIYSLTEEFSECFNIPIQKYIENIDQLFTPEAELAIYRIIQEIFTNISKHASAASVKIHIKKQAHKATFEVEDNGNGFDLNNIEVNVFNRKGVGLISMKQRVRMLDGDLEIESHLKNGTKINFAIPFVKSDLTS